MTAVTNAPRSAEPAGGSVPRIGHFAVAPVTRDPERDYRAIIDLAVHAERSGFDTFWVAEGHVATSGLPAALAFLAALSQRTQSIRLGTAVITLAFENPLALAETAGVVEVLSGGRLELGLGKSNRGGWSSSAFAAFELDEADRDALFAEALERFRDALAGRSSGREVTLHPPARHLRSRIWQATSRATTAAAAGAAGDGLQLHRKALEGETGREQSALIDAYLDALGDREPRIAVSRVVLPAHDRAEAVALFRRYASTRVEYYRRFDHTRPVEEHLIDANIAYGSPGDIAEALRADAAARRATEILFSIPLPFDAPEYRDGIAAISRDIGPQLGSSARARAGATVS
ncbi:LLM class flavin-dependent oxidoreductase [Microbacterium sp. CFBP9034]|uniref:LLM class flavin-dependent oxidoreductase n=1 Tax=Microbacterium sp. CFBP9034 TaxID=3096540 RepID=UPI002A6A6C3F|nr:LLM class flavin-dependent oxidoreductase [Microbacterium sp. CFBP9034]MDY0910206.1 LLM class flavin-dependent oxidoreductase [Microbacterium sp. CFBP9034]